MNNKIETLEINKNSNNKKIIMGIIIFVILLIVVIGIVISTSTKKEDKKETSQENNSNTVVETSKEKYEEVTEDLISKIINIEDGFIKIKLTNNGLNDIWLNKVEIKNTEKTIYESEDPFVVYSNEPANLSIPYAGEDKDIKVILYLEKVEEQPIEEVKKDGSIHVVCEKEKYDKEQFTIENYYEYSFENYELNIARTKQIYKFKNINEYNNFQIGNIENQTAPELEEDVINLTKTYYFNLKLPTTKTGSEILEEYKNLVEEMGYKCN